MRNICSRTLLTGFSLKRDLIDDVRHLKMFGGGNTDWNSTLERVSSIFFPQNSREITRFPYLSPTPDLLLDLCLFCHYSILLLVPVTRSLGLTFNTMTFL